MKTPRTLRTPRPLAPAPVMLATFLAKTLTVALATATSLVLLPPTSASAAFTTVTSQSAFSSLANPTITQTFTPPVPNQIPSPSTLQGITYFASTTGLFAILSVSGDGGAPGEFGLQAESIGPVYLSFGGGSVGAIGFDVFVPTGLPARFYPANYQITVTEGDGTVTTMNAQLQMGVSYFGFVESAGGAMGSPGVSPGIVQVEIDPQVDSGNSTVNFSLDQVARSATITPGNFPVVNGAPVVAEPGSLGMVVVGMGVVGWVVRKRRKTA